MVVTEIMGHKLVVPHSTSLIANTITPSVYRTEYSIRLRYLSILRGRLCLAPCVKLSPLAYQIGLASGGRDECVALGPPVAQPSKHGDATMRTRIETILIGIARALVAIMSQLCSPALM